MAVYPSQSIQDTHDAQKDSAKGADQKPELYGRMGKEHERLNTDESRKTRRQHMLHGVAQRHSLIKQPTVRNESLLHFEIV